jgi:broad specificity phosphatase PhoE
MRLYLVRHAAVAVRPDKPSAQWHLSPEGREAARALGDEPYWAGVSAVHTSCEPKAVATAQRIAAPHGLPLRIDAGLREVERPWVEGGYEDTVRHYFAGETLAGWEPPGDALARVRGAIERVTSLNEDAAVASHGLALTLYLRDLLDLDADASFALWQSIRFPDVAIVDPAARRMERAFGG